MATQEIGLNEALEAAGITALETDLAELIVQLADDRPSHILVPAIHRGRAEIRDIFAARMAGRRPRRADRRARGAGRRRPGAPARGVPARAGRHLGGQLRRRRDRHARRRGVRGQRPDVPDAARDPHHRHGHREGRPCLGRPRGLPPAAAALLDRRADEPLHLHLDRRHRRRRAPGVPPGPARQRPLPGAGRRGGPLGAALHPLLRLPERVPGLRADRRSRLRVGLPRPHRRRAHPPAHRPDRRRRPERLAAVCLLAVRRLLRRVPGQDQHPRAARPAARRAHRGPCGQAPDPQPRGRRHGGRRLGHGRRATASRRRAAPRAPRATAYGREGRCCPCRHR